MIRWDQQNIYVYHHASISTNQNKGRDDDDSNLGV